jgi:hypothetical protein
VALLAFSITVTVDGTETAESLLARLTISPLLPAAELSVTVQLSVPAPANVALAQLTAVNVSAGVDTIPVPLKGNVRLPVVELLASVRSPAADPALVGVNCTLTLSVAPPATVTGTLL